MSTKQQTKYWFLYQDGQGLYWFCLAYSVVLFLCIAVTITSLTKGESDQASLDI